MAGEIVSFGIQKLWDLLSQEYELFQGVDDQVAELRSDLNLLNSFLHDAYARKHKSAMVRNCVEEIKGIICDAEDIIETFVLKEKLGKTSGIKTRIRSLACVIPDRREIALEIEGISKKISKVIHVMQSFGIQQMVAEGGYVQPLYDRKREMRHEFAMDSESNLVGLEENVKELLGYLVKDDNIQIVTMTGMGGVGKTTLARQVFNHEDVKKHFNGLAWVCVSQDFTRINVWQTILRALKPEEEKPEDQKPREQKKITEDTLQSELYGLLQTSKSLIVLDDIWKEEHWVLIKKIFPPNKDWKVLLTSRDENVAMRKDGTYTNFKPKCLSDEESSELFHMIVPMKHVSDFEQDEMKEMAKQMIKHCGGLPLAIKVLGGLLAAKCTLHDWNRISENVGSHIMEGTNSSEDNNGSVNNVLSMSYEELPSYLQHCFLYLAHFPEDYPIKVGKLSYYWAAEGVPKPRYYDGAAIRDVAEGYMEELVKRNMVIAERDSITSRFETCHLHDMMREVCLFKAKQENFLKAVNMSSSTADSQSPCISRRFGLQHPPSGIRVERVITNPKVRSLLVISDGEYKNRCKLSGSFKRLQLMRVLDLFCTNSKRSKLPSSIGKLIHLRYLSLERAKVSHLPSSLRNLKLLIYLNLDVVLWDTTIFVPNVLMGMLELRYLSLPWKMHKKTKLALSNLVNLETLKDFSTKNSSLEDLRGMTRLKTLEINIDSKTNIKALSESIAGLKYLETLDIVDHHNNVIITSDREGFVLDCVNLRQLKLGIYMPKLPDEQPLPSHLTTISLETCCLEKDPMPILEKLLQLKEVSLRYRSFSGMTMVCSTGGFPQLQKLKLRELEDWEEWTVKEGSMPLLHTLSIWFCPKLKELPDGLRFVTSLKELHTRSTTGRKWKERLSEGGEDYCKIQHIPSVRIIEEGDEISTGPELTRHFSGVSLTKSVFSLSS